MALKAWESSFCLHPREVLPTVYSYIFHYLSQASALYCLVEPISDLLLRLWFMYLRRPFLGGGIAASEGKEMGPENGYEGELRPHEVDAPPAYLTAVKVR